MGLYAVIENHTRKSNRTFFFLSTTAALWILCLYLAYYFEGNNNLVLIFIRFANSIPILTLFFIGKFFYEFPAITYKLPKYIRVIFEVILIGSFFVSAFTPFVQTSIEIVNGQIASETLGVFFSIYTIIIIVAFVLVAVFAHKKLQLTRGIEKAKLKIILISFFSIAILATTTNLVLPQFGIIVFVKESVLYTVLMIAPMLYAIHKHRFFHISYFALNTLRLIIFLASFLIIALTLTVILESLLPSINQTVLILIVSGITLITFQKLSKYLPKLSNNNLKELQTEIDKFISGIYYCEKFEKLIDHLEETFIKKLNIRNVKFYIVKKDKPVINLPIYEKNNFTEILSNIKKEIIVTPELAYKKMPYKDKEVLKNELNKLNATLCIPLFAENKLIGFIILGKKNNKNYSQEEIKEIKRIKKDMEIETMNLLLKLNLQEENNLMKEIIEQKTEALRKQFQEIKSLLEQQSDFIAVTAHEFRTPLSIALFQLEDTLSSHSHSPQVVQDMEIMNESLNNLKELTQKLFDVQQYDLNKIKLRAKEINIVEFVKQLYLELGLIMKDKKIRFEFINEIDDAIKIQIDKIQLRQVMSNLLNNAIKFIDSKNPLIQIKLEEEDNLVIISVSNTGKPIPDKDKKRIFEKFQTTKVTMGTGIGLGLYICKKIIELHNGKIWVTDKKNMTKFSISLRK